MWPVRLLYPPYDRYCWPSEGTPPFGAVAVCEARSSGLVSGFFGPLVARAPWCVPCIITCPASAEASVIQAIRSLPGQIAFVDYIEDDRWPIGTILGAVRDRPPPSGAVLAEFVALRTGTNLEWELAALLGDQRLEASARPIPDRTLRERLSRFGSLSPRAWRAVGTLCRVASAARGDPMTAIAWRAGVEVRTLRLWARWYLGTSLAEYRQRVGWEWVLEAALRKAGYVEGPSLVALPLRQPWAPPVPPTARAQGQWRRRNRRIDQGRG